VCDFDGDCGVTVDDLNLIAGQWHQPVIPHNTRYDLNGDGEINVMDIALTTIRLGHPCSGGIEFTYVPPYGSFDDILGQARCVEPADYKVAVYIYVSGWWTKPYWASPLTPIQSDGSWTADITTGGTDQLATKIAAFLVPNGYNPPQMGGGQTLPAELFGNSTAWVTVEREAVFRTIEFSGYTWRVKASETPAGPGPNYFSDRPEDVWVDAEGLLHLRIVHRDGKWYSTEVFTEAPLGYGQYIFHLASRVDQLDKNIVLGLFTWDDTAPEHNYREVDIEFSRWGDAGNDNAQFVVQPWNNPGNMHRFNAELQADESTHGFDWRADRVFFQSMQGRQPFPGPAGSEIAAWTYAGDDIPPAGEGNARINLWLLNGNPPSDGAEAEVIIEAFEFVPFNPTTSNDSYSHLYAVMDQYTTGDTPRLLDSYEPTATWDDGDTAWVYDNALVMLALMARGTDEDWARAKVLADSLIYAQNHDPDFNDGRLRDAYHASAFIGQDGKAQVAAPGSGVGNMAFAILALLRYWEVKGGDAYLEAATRLGQWIHDHTYDTRGPGGYTGGYAGNPPGQTRHQWKATEHNIDVYPTMMKLYEATGDSRWLRRAMHAKNFVRAMWNEAGGHFWTGTLNDGASINPSPIPEDTQSWGLMALSEVDRYGAGITWAENNLLVDPCPSCEACKGFRFSDQGAGCWWEGTAHMTIAFQIKDDDDKAGEFLEVLRKVQTTVPNNNGQGIVSACPGGADSGYGGTYPNALHIGATAWYLFAERHHNPFWGIRTDEPIPYAGLYDALLETIARDTWNYLSSDWATDNHLPWSWRSPQMPDGDYANPAEIGFYMLSYIGAYELQKDWSPSWVEVEAEVGATLDQLEAWQSGTQAYQPHGPNAYNNSVFYQAYWINENPPVVGAGNYDHQVPSIDNAWLAASLITIREYAEANGKTTLAQKADGVLRDMDFTIWYHPEERLFNWGAPDDPRGGTLADYYSNENRIINFVTRALGQLSEEEFQASLAALKQSSGTYDGGTPDPSDDITVGKVNWDGSYFTYPAPALFIREMETAYGKDTIDKATEAQIAYAQAQGYPVWGISDAFDVEDGGYVERGAPPRGSDDPLDDEDDGLITPHAGALALITGHAHESIDNLQTLQDRYPAPYDADHGFKDSVNVNSGKISYRFSALGQEWIFLSLMNYLGDGVIWRYFYQDEGVQRAYEEMYRDSGGFPISTEAHDQLTLALTYNSGDNEYLVAWEDRRNATDHDYEIRGRRVSGDGTLVGDEFVISAAQYPQKWPAVTYNDRDNTYLVVWVRWRSIYNTREDWEWDIYGQVLGSDGTLIDGNFAIATADRRKRSPAVAYCSSAGQYLVVWDDIGFVQGQLVSSGGALLDNPTTPEDESDSGVSFRTSTAGSTQVHPDVVYNGQDREFFVVWRDARHAGLNYNDDVYGQRVSCMGELLVEGDIPISTQQVVDPDQQDPYIAPNGQNGPAVAYNAIANEYLVVWHDGRNDPDGDESDLDLYGERVSASGELLDNSGTPEDETDPAINFPISMAAGKQWLPDIAYDGTVNRYLVVWTDWRNGDLDSDIYGQQISGTGELVGEEFVIEDAGGNQGNLWFGWDSEEEGGLAVANNSRSHEFLAVWTDCRNADTTGCDIYGQRYKSLPFKVFLPGVTRTGP